MSASVDKQAGQQASMHASKQASKEAHKQALSQPTNTWCKVVDAERTQTQNYISTYI